MFKRTIWFGAGIAAGASGTVWAQRKVKEQLARAQPSHLANRAIADARRLGTTLKEALDEGRSVATERELDLRRRYDLGGEAAQRATES